MAEKAGGAIMNYDVFKGELVRLAAIDTETIGPVLSHWLQDTEFSRLEDTEPVKVFSPKQVQITFEKILSDGYFFAIHALADDKLIGMIDLSGFDWPGRNAWVGVGLGDREYWGKGYGTDVMHVLLRFAFHELNLHRVNLNVFEYNPRAIRCYEKVGFKHEGRMRSALNRDGRRWDLVYMGILRSEWEERPQGSGIRFQEKLSD
jgi:RimJ/RimL family protein N-acetyltransferase